MKPKIIFLTILILFVAMFSNCNKNQYADNNVKIAQEKAEYTRFKNIHTNEIRILVRIEYVKNYPDWTKVWVFDDGSRRNYESMKHWVKINEIII